MTITQYYLECLSQASYLVADEDTAQAVIVDPRRDVDEYLADLDERGLTLVGVIDTHFHADFLAGHLELARATGAWIGFGATARADFPIRALRDGERLSLGEVELEILETPGHTPESISVLVREHAGEDPTAVLTGDTLFVGDVGRPDLLASIGVTADELGRALYRSVRRLMALPDEVRVYPAHGAGSACGKNLSTELSSTIGDQRATNPACGPMTEDEFLAVVTSGQPAAPAYFLHDAMANRHLHPVLDIAAELHPLSLDDVMARQAAGVVVLDVRDTDAYAASHVVGSLAVQLDGRFAETAGSVVPTDRDIVLVAEQDREHEAALRLARIGFDRVAGYLREPHAALAGGEHVATTPRLSVTDARRALAGAPRPVVLDVRNPGEIAVAGTIDDAATIPLAALPGRLDELPRTTPVVVLCASGYRSSTAASLLRRAGFADVTDLRSGWDPALAPAAVS